MNARPSRVLLTLNLGAVTNALKAVPAAVRINDRHMSSSPMSNRAKMALPTRTLPQTSLGKQGIAARRLNTVLDGGLQWRGTCHLLFCSRACDTTAHLRSSILRRWHAVTVRLATMTKNDVRRTEPTNNSPLV